MKTTMILFMMFLGISVFGQNVQPNLPIIPQEEKTITIKSGQIVVQSDTLRHLRSRLAEAQAKKDLWGGVKPISYLIGLLFALIGIFINTFVLTVAGVSKNTDSPQKFSWSYWWHDNKGRILRWIGLLFVILVCMRFSKEVFDMDFTMFVAFLLGLCLDRVVEIVRNLKTKLPAPVKEV
jgi:hypothetical protein